MPAEITLPAIPIVLATAAIDSINPCAIGVLILLITTLLTLSKDKKRMLWIGTIYILAVYVTYLAAGLGLLYFIQKLNIAEPIGIVVGGLVILLGFVEIKDFWWYGQGFSLHIPTSKIAQIKRYVKKASIPGAIVLGAFVSAVELPCTGGPYLAITTLLAKIGLSTKVFGYLALYNFIFVLPLIIILVIAYFGVQSRSIKAWKMKYRKWMRLATGIVMIALGVLLILFAKGIIRFGIS
jgi:cytochrome c biogenesis protein CcdA